MPIVARVINSLFDRNPAPNGKPYTNREIARTARQNGFNVSEQTLGSIRSGTIENPGILTLAGVISAFPNVSFSVFDRVLEFSGMTPDLESKYHSLVDELGVTEKSQELLKSDVPLDVAVALLEDIQRNSRG